MSNTWPGGYQAAVTVKNGSAMISSWKTSFALPSGGAVAERLVRHVLAVRLDRDGVQRRLERAARLRRIDHLRLRGQRHRTELLDHGELHRQLITH